MRDTIPLTKEEMKLFLAIWDIGGVAFQGEIKKFKEIHETKIPFIARKLSEKGILDIVTQYYVDERNIKRKRLMYSINKYGCEIYDDIKDFNICLINIKNKLSILYPSRDRTENIRQAKELGEFIVESD